MATRPGNPALRRIAMAPAFDPEEEAALWRRYRTEADPAAKEALASHYLGFAQILAGKVYSSRYHDEIEFAEYMQFASVGLLEALERFNPALGVKFKTFAGRRIIGAMLNGLETVTEKQQQIAFRKRIASERLESLKEGRAAKPQPDELFHQLAQMAVGLALGYMLDDSSMYRHRNATYSQTGYEAVELEQLQKRVRGLVEDLPERERKVIKYHYMNQFQFDEIAGLMGVTKGRISQIHKHAIELLALAVKRVRNCDIAW
jgi:RNA polymerase sigma factor for flagellar operon FliA